MRGAGQVPSHTFPLSRDPTHFQLPGQPASLSRTEGHLSTNKILTVAMFMDWTGEAGDQMMMDGQLDILDISLLNDESGTLPSFTHSRNMCCVRKANFPRKDLRSRLR